MDDDMGAEYDVAHLQDLVMMMLNRSKDRRAQKEKDENIMRGGAEGVGT